MISLKALLITALVIFTMIALVISSYILYVALIAGFTISLFLVARYLLSLRSR